MLPKQKEYSVGIYMRLSKDDERAGESLSIENQRNILTSYVKEQGWTIYDEYIDDGISGVSFNRPGVQRMLDDAKNGKINLIICKDLSRFGRNYIQVGQYTDYIFPAYNIRFIALNDNVDTENINAQGMDMLPIMNIFNEWHSANTSKKLRAVHAACAKQGKYKTTFSAYGYDKANDGKNTPTIDPVAADVVKRIFEMYAKGMKMKQIADVLNSEHILTPFDYHYQKIGKPNPHYCFHLWGTVNIRCILDNPIYTGKLAQHRRSTVSYKNKKTVFYDENDWIVVENNHEPIISQELWDKVREIRESTSTGRRTKKGEMKPLSGFLYCDECGTKMRLEGGKGSTRPAFKCGKHARYGKGVCSSHYIIEEIIERIILEDIQSMITLTVDEDEARKKFMERKAGYRGTVTAQNKKRTAEIEHRITELGSLIQKIYEDRLLGKVPEDLCMELLEKYQVEKKDLQSELDDIRTRQELENQDERDVEEFIRRLKKYAGVKTLTREMALELIEYVTVDKCVPHSNAPRTIHIYYKFLDKRLNDKRNAFM